ncbi:MAG: 16S rRNA (guanine(527)-N(7))-methyltransferase RsmG [Hyphomicrobiaceae bacterium]|nr:16S rRNA (guanine(527)-N(7))-methyltransferase RsmG [Hyphomicrobiaceae bacterium]
MARLEAYEGLLRRWQKTINLVAPRTLDEIWQRHFADSAQLIDLVEEPLGRWVDLGSGAGFPGLVIAILRHGLPGGAEAPRVTLVESDTRKAAFLTEVARQTAVPVDIVARRIELVSTQGRLAPARIVSARALAPLGRLIELAAPLFGPGTIGVFPKGREAAHEIAEARRASDFEARLVPSRTDAEARIVLITNPVARTGGAIEGGR